MMLFDRTAVCISFRGAAACLWRAHRGGPWVVGVVQMLLQPGTRDAAARCMRPSSYGCNGEGAAWGVRRLRSERTGTLPRGRVAATASAARVGLRAACARRRSWSLTACICTNTQPGRRQSPASSRSRPRQRYGPSPEGGAARGRSDIGTGQLDRLRGRDRPQYILARHLLTPRLRPEPPPTAPLRFPAPRNGPHPPGGRPAAARRVDPP